MFHETSSLKELNNVLFTGMQNGTHIFKRKGNNAFRGNIAFDATTLPKGKIPIATQSDPEKMCGIARRIGYSGSSQNAFALYRLKLYTPRPTIMETLPGYFVLEQGVFRDYTQLEHSKSV